MKHHRQIVNPEQQPWNRRYRRERDRYFEDEARDFERGADYTGSRARASANFENRDYSPQNRWERQYLRQAPFSEQQYPPSRDYGYSREEYYDRAPWSHRDVNSEAVGYGNDYSNQGRDFENWMHSSDRYRNLDIRELRDHRFPGRSDNQHDNVNNDFSEGLYDYRKEQQYHEGRYRKAYDGRGGKRSRQKGYVDHKYHNRSDRHPEIVRPFKDYEDYSPNYYNESEGFGDNEMVFRRD